MATAIDPVKELALMSQPGLRELNRPLPAGPDVALLVFTLGPQRLGLAAEQVSEIIRAVAIAPLPQAPPIVEGVINYRGTIVPVLDIRQRFRLPAVLLHPDQHFVVAQSGPRLVALRVDRATEFVSVKQSAIEPASELIPGVQHTAGIAKLPDGLLVIHDLGQFLALEEATQLDQALRGPDPSAGRPKRRGSA